MLTRLTEEARRCDELARLKVDEIQYVILAASFTPEPDFREGSSTVDDASDEYQLEHIGRDHRIGAEVFVPFAIVRLSGDTDATEATLMVRLQGIGQAGQTHWTLHLWWSADSAPTHPLGVSERTVTEWAAYGVACAVVSFYTGLCVRQVTADGDRFDY